MTDPVIIEAAARALEEFRQAFVVAVGDQSPFAKQALLRADAALAALPLIEAAALEREPTEEMLIAARDWSYAKYGKPIGNDAAKGCYHAMTAAAIRALIPKDSGGGR